jgi:hypothetical protein
LTFSLQGRADFDVQRVELLYVVDGDDTRNLELPTFTPGPDIDVSQSIDTRVRFIPAGIDVTYWWRLVGRDGLEAETEPDTILWYDNRFQWDTVQSENVTVYSYTGNEDFSREILDSADRTIERLRADFDVDQIEPIRIWAYNSQEDFRGTLAANSESWIAGAAYPDFRVILAVLPKGDSLEVRRIVPHEISHQVVQMAAQNPFNYPATWLDEGLAVYHQEGGDQDFPALVQEAADEGRLFSIRALNSQFPLDRADTVLAYAESLSIVRFIIDHYGADKMADLIDVYRGGVSHDQAVKRTLGVDLDELDRLWKESLGYAGNVGVAGGSSNQMSPGDGWSLIASGTFVMALAGVATIVVLVLTARRARRPDDSTDSAW